MKINRNLPNKQVTSNTMTIKHWHALIAHEAIVESTVTLLDIEFPTYLLSPTQTTTNKIMEIINSNPQAD